METENVKVAEWTFDKSIKSISDLRKKVAELKAELENAAVGTEQAAKASEEYRSAQKALNAALQGSAEVVGALEGSYNSLSTKMAALKQRYHETTSEMERQELAGQINDINNQLKDMDARVGQFGRNVGNYAGSLSPMFDALGVKIDGIGGTFTKVMNTMAAGGGSFSKVMQNGIAGVITSFKTLLANPMVLFITAIVKVVMLLVDQFKKSDNAMTALGSAMKSLQPIITVVKKAFEAVVETLGVVIGAIGNFIGGLTGVGEATRDLEIAFDELEDKEREYTVNSARNSKYIAELRARATETDKYTAEQRKKFLQEAMDREKENLEMQKNIARERLEIAIEEARQKADTSDETKNKIAELQAAMYKADEEYASGTRRLLAQLVTARKEEAKRYEEIKKQKLEALKKAKEEERRIELENEDLRIALIKNEYSREIETINSEYNRKIEAIEQRLKEENDLTVKARIALNEQLEILELTRSEKVEKIFEKWSAANDETQKQIDEANAAREEEQLDHKLEVLDQLLAIQDAHWSTELQKLKEKYDAEQLIIDGAYNDEIISQKQYETASKKLAAEHSKEVASLYLNKFSSVAGGINDLLGAISENFDESSKEYKGFAIAQATISMLTGVAQAVSQAMQLGPILGPIMGAINSATVIASGVAQINKIKATTLQNNETSASVASTTASSSALASISAPDTIGTITGASQMYEMSNQKVYVTETDISNTQNKVKVAQGEATF